VREPSSRLNPVGTAEYRPATQSWTVFSRPCGTQFVNPASRADTKAPDVRFSNRQWLRPTDFEKRTSAAKAVIGQSFSAQSKTASPWFSSPWVSRRLMGTRLKPCPSSRASFPSGESCNAVPLVQTGFSVLMQAGQGANRMATTITRPMFSISVRYFHLRLEAGERGCGMSVSQSAPLSNSHQPQT
jgi:hypothetical protein